MVRKRAQESYPRKRGDDGSEAAPGVAGRSYPRKCGDDTRRASAAPIGSTDQDRIRHPTVALPPQYAAGLFDAQQAGVGDQRLKKIAAEALKEVYFQDNGRRAGSLDEVRFTDIEHLEFDLWTPPRITRALDHV
ncbi:hypothetical protein GCM10010266_72870 [Streptomyces griseomycini]|nr:hypothetical protein GCM10010266_72870 [Streptomyces griseomycini]